MTITINHPATWTTTVMYNREEYIISGEETYTMCYGLNGMKVDCTLTTYHYIDGTQSAKITGINNLVIS